MHLTFANGNMTGEGNDDVGRFLIKGRYDAPTKECHWTKTYVGAHDVFYRGFREGKGIWGTWEINILGPRRFSYLAARGRGGRCAKRSGDARLSLWMRLRPRLRRSRPPCRRRPSNDSQSPQR